MKVDVSKTTVRGLAAGLDYSLSKLGKWGFGEELDAVRKARDVIRGIEMQFGTRVRTRSTQEGDIRDDTE